ncbi:MAG: aminotransferase class V-fold PLP-dependent enzyme [Bacteroidales bacterium]|nr:aminotransferase class V-fold PLP-dependent enzyme [Bacteroidales bacterium]
MPTELETYFSQFKKNIIGNDTEFETPFGKQKMLYADWIASGRLYKPIEEKMQKLFGPMIGNTHSEASETGVKMTKSYILAKKIIKQHVNASDEDIIITSGAGMTRVVNKLQRILGLKLPDSNTYFKRKTGIDFSKTCDLGDNKPVVFVTHVEHHSNHFSWVETISDVVLLEPCEDLKVCTNSLEDAIVKYKNRKIKIGAFSGGSNVTGCIPPVHEYAKIMHKNGGLCFIDYAASAPYIDINMHPDDTEAYFDAIYFSPHKFLGGPGSAAVLIFNENLYKNKIPDNPGGGTVQWTNRWNECSYHNEPEMREDGGTPAFTQTIRTALSIKLKEKMGVANILKREEELLEIVFEELRKIDTFHILAENIRSRIGVVTFYSETVHHNLIVKILNDRYGIQTRGGCSCAGPYGHYLFNIDKKISKLFTNKIDAGDSSEKPGWVRLSLHPTMTNDELYFAINALKEIIDNAEEWKKDYYQDKSGEWFLTDQNFDCDKLNSWFEF